MNSIIFTKYHNASLGKMHYAGSEKDNCHEDHLVF